METLTLTQKISLEPKFFNSNIHKHIYQKLKTMLEGKCTQEHGYVVGIEEKIEILDNDLSRTSSFALVHVRFNVNTLKPRKGQIVEGVVCMIFEQGIFVDVQEKMKVLIPLENLKKYKYINGTFKHKKHVISQGDTIRVKIDLIKYERKSFNCIGFLEV